MGRLSPQQLNIINYGTQILRPNPTLSGSEWADEYYFLSSESSAIPGKWQTYPWQKEPLDAMTVHENKVYIKKDINSDTFSGYDDLIEKEMVVSTVVFQKPTRVGYTKILSAVAAYYIHQRPSVQLHYQPNADEAKGFAEDEFEPMIRDNTVISELIQTPNIRGRRKPQEKTIKKLYPGGYVEFLGAESDRNFNRRTARVVSGDEIDTWKKEAGNAGDTVTTMMRRTSDFWDRKNILGGKPIGAEYNPKEEEDLAAGISVVNYWFKKGTQEHRYLPCPHCHQYQKFESENLVWDKDQDENKKTIKHYPNTAHFQCKSCGKKIYDKHKRQMDKQGIWIVENIEAIEDKIRSFHIWAMLSYSPNVTWPDIAKEFLQSKKSRLKLKTYHSEVLARTWEEDYEKVDIGDFESRKELYTAQVPEGVLILTFGADTQDDRIECEVIGWGEAEESWSIEYKVFHGDTSKPEVWERFDEFLLKTYTHESGGLMRVYCGCVDTGGHRAKSVYGFCKPRFARRVFAIKGAKAIDAPIAPRLASRKNKANVPLYMVGVNQAKDVIYSHIMTEAFGPGYMHFPEEPIYNDEYFKQLTAEKRSKDGRWVPTRSRNEALDCRGYGYSSLFIAGVDLEILAQHGPLLHSERDVERKRKRKPKKPSNYLEEY